jgi:flagellar hook protein FlgE
MAMDALFTAVTGMEANQQMLDVVGNNLANENTTGFQAQTVNFSDLLYQTLNQGTGPTANLGGTNPVQTGTGVQVESVSTNTQQGTLQTTGNNLDMALQGNGYFVVNDGAQSYYTRDGAFGINADGYLIDPATGDLVQRTGTVGEGGPNSPVFQASGNSNILLPTNGEIPGTATSSIALQGNLSASASGPVAEVLTSANAFTVAGGGAAVLTTKLNSLSDNVAQYVNGDSITLQGVDGLGNSVNVSVPVTANTTMGDVINAINTNFQGVTASLSASGNIVVQSNTTGTSNLNVSITDAANNTGSSNWAGHALSVTTPGAAGTTVNTSIQVYDAQGNAHTLNLTFQKQSNNSWNLTAGLNPGDGTVVNGTISNITFNQDGSFSQVNGTNDAISLQFNGASSPQQIAFTFGTAGGFNGLTQLGGTSSAVATGQNGFQPGTLSSLTIGQDGTISGVFTNGQTLAIAQLAVASFANPSGLDRVGSNYYATSANSGVALIGAGQTGGRGAVEQGELESSNVDVSTEFTNLIIAQRGFEVNAHVLTAGDQILQDLINVIH